MSAKKETEPGCPYITWKGFLSISIPALLLIFTVGAWGLKASNAELHPDGMSIREVVGMEKDLKADIATLRVEVKADIIEVKTDIREMRKEAREDTKELNKTLQKILVATKK